MKVKFLINIKKDNQIIGNCFTNIKSSSTDILITVKKIIDNYNKRLCTAYMNKYLIAIKLFMCSDKNGNDKMAPAGICEKSIDYLKKEYALDLSNKKVKKTDSMHIALFSSHNMEMIITDDFYVDVKIDFDEKNIYANCFGKVDMETYEKTNLHQYKICPYNFEKLSFNDLEDAIVFLQEVGSKGFLFNKDDIEVSLAFV